MTAVEVRTPRKRPINPLPFPCRRRESLYITVVVLRSVGDLGGAGGVDGDVIILALIGVLVFGARASTSAEGRPFLGPDREGALAPEASLRFYAESRTSA